MKKISQFAIWFFVTLLVFQSPLVLAENSINVIATLRVNSLQEIEILFSLKNKARRPIYILNSELPWNGSSALVLVATDMTGGALKQISAISDPNFQDVIKIDPGNILSGSVVLDHHFPEIDNGREKRELLIFWSYLPLAFGSSLSKLDRVGGWLPLTVENGRKNSPRSSD